MPRLVVLAVDDSQESQRKLKQLLSDHFSDCHLLTAETIAKGLETAREAKPDIVLTEVEMPDGDGIEFCRLLKTDPDTSGLVVLLLVSDKSSPDAAAKGLAAGALDFISKPVDALTFVARISAALRIRMVELQVLDHQERFETELKNRTLELNELNCKLRDKIKEGQRAEEALKQSNRRFLSAMEGTDDGFWELDLQNGIITYDANWARVLGYDAVETSFDQEWWESHIDPLCFANANDAMTQYLSGKEKYYETEYRIKNKFGEWIWVWARGVCTAYDEANNPLRIVGTQRDITEKRQNEEAFQRLVTAIEQVEDIIIITDEKAKIQYINPSFERVTGYQKSDVLGANPNILKSGLHDYQFYQDLWQQISSGEVWSGKLVNKRKNGTLYHEQATITPVINLQGVITNYIAVKRDVTHQVKLESQLRQAQKMEAIGTLAGGIAHDFNNILFAIQGYNSLSLRLLEEDHPAYDHLQKLEGASERAKDLVAQILTFSRQTEQELKPMMVQPVLKEAMNLLRATIPSTIEVRQNINPDAGMIMGDLIHVHQIIINLATNAYHAMREKGGVLTVTLDSVLVDPAKNDAFQGMMPGPYIELFVSDSGSGMSQTTVERIFEPYFSTKGQGEGTGMGLSIVHGIVAAYQGKIFVESKIGHGTSFKVLLPELETPHTEEKKEKPAMEIDLKGNERILVLDDEAQILAMLKNMLEDLGYQVDAYASSEEALSTFEMDPDRYDLILTDMTMPKITGAELAAKVLDIRPSFPIILCTGYSEKINETLAKEIGIKEFLMKPVSIDRLARIIRNTLNIDSPLKEPLENR